MLKVLAIFSLFLLSITYAQEEVKYNFDCPFKPQMQLANHTLDIYALGEFYPYLVENERGFLSFKLKVLGNWSEYSKESKNKLSASIRILCDGEPRASLGGYPSSVNLIRTQENVTTEFVWNEDFSIPSSSEKKFCYAVVKIVGINETWMQESKCGTCACWVNGLSGFSFALDSPKEIWSKSTFFSKLQIESQEKQFWSGAIIGIIGSILGSIVGILGTYYVQKRSQDRMWRKAEIEEIYVPLHREIKNTANILEKYTRSDFSPSQWDRSSQSSSYWKIKTELRKKLERFYTELLPDYIRLFDKVRKQVYAILEQEAKKISRDTATNYLPLYGAWEMPNHRGDLVQVSSVEALIEGKTPREILSQKVDVSKWHIEVAPSSSSFTNDKHIIEHYDKLIDVALKVIKKQNLIEERLKKKEQLIKEARNLEKELELKITKLTKL